MAKRKRKRKTTRRRSTSQSEYPGWMWMLFGLAVGLSVAYAIYQKYRVPVVETAAAPRQQPASMSATIDTASTPPVEVEEEDPADRRFSFYEMLPKFEVIIPDQEPEVERDVGAEAVEQPGVYMLQAGSFTENSDADRRRAQLALLGVESRIQRVTIDDRAYHRVRIGPIENLDELNRVRSRLREANIDVLRIRLSE